MPLYTYIITYKNENYISQTRRSNPKGFTDWMEALPPPLRKLISNPFHGSFEAVPDRKNVWRQIFVADGSELRVVTVQTDE